MAKKKKQKPTKAQANAEVMPMATRDEQLAVLTAELRDDPLGRGYNGPGTENPGPGPMTDMQAAESLNLRNIPTTGGNVSLQELWEDLIDDDEATAMRENNLNDFNNVVLLGQNAPLSVTATDYFEIALAFPGGSQTRINMNNRAQGLESRGEQLTLPRPIKDGWVQAARGG